MRTLDQMKTGEQARIVGLEAQPASRRLMEMGIIDNERVEVRGFAPMGDPMLIAVGDARLSLRKREARLVRVAPIS